jgi:hypothetical protein
MQYKVRLHSLNCNALSPSWQPAFADEGGIAAPRAAAALMGSASTR